MERNSRFEERFNMGTHTTTWNEAKKKTNKDQVIRLGTYGWTREDLEILVKKLTLEIDFRRRTSKTQ